MWGLSSFLFLHPSRIRKQKKREGKKPGGHFSCAYIDITISMTTVIIVYYLRLSPWPQDKNRSIQKPFFFYCLYLSITRRITWKRKREKEKLLNKSTWCRAALVKLFFPFKKIVLWFPHSEPEGGYTHKRCRHDLPSKGRRREGSKVY